MRRSIAQVASVLAVAIVAAFSTTAALADNGNGKDNGKPATAPGQVKQDSTNTAQSSTAPGIKPSNSTEKWTTCKTGGGTGASATCTSSNSKTTNADASKRYGNGKTAAQIANGRGAPAGTTISGPGNSQPHKVSVCPGKTNKSGGKDVHAVKSYSTASCGSQPAENPPPPQQTQTQTQTQTPFVATSSSQVSSSSTQPSSSTSSRSTTESTPQFAATSAVTQSVASTPTSRESGVLGAVASISSPAPAKAQGGVLGAGANVSGATLPFSGFPLWAAMLAAFALLLAGIALRRRSA